MAVSNLALRLYLAAREHLAMGAHIGAVAFGTARLVGESGRVVASDADPENVASLRDSCVLNQFKKRVRIVHAAVWSFSANQGIPFRRGATRRSHGCVIADGHPPLMADGVTITVPSTTLDAFTAAEGPVPELIKIDSDDGSSNSVTLRSGASHRKAFLECSLRGPRNLPPTREFRIVLA